MLDRAFVEHWSLRFVSEAKRKRKWAREVDLFTSVKSVHRAVNAQFLHEYSSYTNKALTPTAFAAVLQSAPDYAYSKRAQKAGNTKV